MSFSIALITLSIILNLGYRMLTHSERVATAINEDLNHYKLTIVSL